MRIDFGNRHFATIPDLSTRETDLRPGTFFSNIVVLGTGPHTALIQVQLHKRTPEATVRMEIFKLNQKTMLASKTQVVDNASNDRVILPFEIDGSGPVEFRGWVDRDCFGTLLRFATIVPARVESDNDERFFFHPTLKQEENFDVVILGTVSRCPASCQNCPTNKVVTRHVPKGVMASDLFDNIVNDLRDIGFVGPIVFGLYGEPLLDPLLAKRIAKIRKKLKYSSVHIATTASIYDEKLHSEIVDASDGIAVHMEAINPELYDAMMEPLKASRAFPRIAALLKKAGSKAHIVTPIGYRNLSEIEPILNYSKEIRAGGPEFAALSNRCGFNDTFDSDAISPLATCCSPDKIARELVVDWDGTIVACCFDFMRSGELGNLAKNRLSEFIGSKTRKDFLEKMNRKEWCGLEACKNCRLSEVKQTNMIVQSVVSHNLKIQYISPVRFIFSDDLELKEGCLVTKQTDFNLARQEGNSTGSKAESTNLMKIWGPYDKLPKGAYSAQIHIEVKEWEEDSRLRFEILLNEDVVAWRDFNASMTGPLTAPFIFAGESDAVLQVRVASYRLAFKFMGVQFEHFPFEAIAPIRGTDRNSRSETRQSWLSRSLGRGRALLQRGFARAEK